MKRVLIVDDSDIIRQTLKKLLPNYGDLKIVGECSDGNQVLDFLNHTAVDTILLDYHMPIINGPETARFVKKYFNHIHIILHTSDSEAAYLVRDVDEVVIKPSKLSDIAYLIENNKMVSSR